MLRPAVAARQKQATARMGKNEQPSGPPAIALYGGAFDPVHNAHLEIARRARAASGAERVVFVPAARSPLKPRAPEAPDGARVAMLERALAGEPGLTVDRYELECGGTSYSVRTARHFAEREPEARLYWVLGGDQFERLPEWREIEALCRMVVFLVVARPGAGTAVPDLPDLRFARVDAPLMEESSSRIRERLRRGRSIAGSVPPAVETFIAERGLYTNGE